MFFQKELKKEDKRPDDYEFILTIDYIQKILNLGYGIILETKLHKFEWYTGNSNEFISDNTEIKQLRTDRKELRDEIVSIEFYRKEKGLI